LPTRPLSFPPDFSTFGKKIVTVTYQGKTATFWIFVNMPEEKFSITYESHSGGTISGVERERVGERVRVTITTNDGWTFVEGSVIVLNSWGEAFAAIKFNNVTLTYWFEMPDDDVTVSARWTRNAASSLPFDDFKVLDLSGTIVRSPLNGFGTDIDPFWGDDYIRLFGYWSVGFGVGVNTNEQGRVHGDSHSIASYVGAQDYMWGRIIRTPNNGVDATGYGVTLTDQEIESQSTLAPFDGTGYDGVSFWFKFEDSVTMTAGTECYFVIVDDEGIEVHFDFIPALSTAWQEFQVDFPDGFNTSAITGYMFGMSAIGAEFGTAFFISDMKLIKY